MALSYIGRALSKGKYWGWFLIPAIIVFVLYVTVLANTKAFGAQGLGYLVFNWIFAIVMPLLVGLVIAVQAYNQRENKTCPVGGTTTGAIGGLIGIATVACPMCPAVLLGWIGLAAAIPSALLASVWVKGLSLILLVLALLFATKGQK